MDKKINIVSSIISIVLGFVLIIMKGEVINLAITLLGAAVIVWAIADFVNGFVNLGIVKGVIGVCILVFGWIFVNLALYILAASIIIKGLLQIANINRFPLVDFTVKDKILIYLKPAVTVLAGACLLLNQGGTIAWIFILAGILLLVEGALELIETIKGNNI